ncbi:MAG: response regulator transcription factor, partial [Gammaproteobacteria bacterium]|nr:response regulator transcription factor [Gammaproteobacteria bacterium]
RLISLDYIVDTALDGDCAQFALQEYRYDLVLLDLGLPKQPGLVVLEKLRAGEMPLNTDTPVLILTARNAWQERVEGLKKGANDYLGKPFQFEELQARIEVLLRRNSVNSGQSEVIEAGGCQLDLGAKQLRVGREAYDLTLTEFRLVKVLLSQPNQLFSKEQLLARISDQDYECESNIIEVYIRKLRKMMGKTAIETSRGLGYKFVGSQIPTEDS